MKVIYIAGNSHSGSTLLDLMLNAHPQIASVGELKQLGRLARFEKPKNRCTCKAASLWECPFWARVNTMTIEKGGKTLADLNVEDYGNVVDFEHDNVLLFETIAELTGKEFIVDSSKEAARLRRLLENPAFDVLPVLLMRDPRGQINSLLQKRPDQYRLRTLIKEYVVRNREVFSLIKYRRHVVVRYERLVERPEATLNGILQMVGLSFDPRQLDWVTPERHNVGGNRMRRKDSAALELDDTWRRELTTWQKWAIQLATLPGRDPLLTLGHR